MARQSNSDKLSQYRQKINLAQKVLEQQNYIQLWQRLINLYRGRHYRGAGVGDRLLVNVAFSTINTLAPAIAIGRPKINVNPRRPEDDDKAVVTESIINYWWQHYGCQPEFQRAAKDYLIIGHGWVKTGYRFVEEKKLDEIQEFKLRFGSTIKRGFIWKMDIDSFYCKMFDSLIAIQCKLRGAKFPIDTIDYEKDRPLVR
jgi:hypothetical protein